MWILSVVRRGVILALGEYRDVELAEVWARDGVIKLVGSLHSSMPSGCDWRLQVVPRAAPAGAASLLSRVRRRLAARRRRSAQPGPYPVSVSAGRLEAVIPVRDLVPPPDVRLQRWDLYLVAESTGGKPPIRLRVGKYSGVPAPAKRITYPAQRRGQVKARPYYTTNDNLAIQSKLS